jgi:hypothetical protein
MIVDRAERSPLWHEQKRLGKPARSVIKSIENQKEVITDGSRQIIGYYGRY